VGRVAQSVQWVATGWTARGWNPCGGTIFHTCPDQPWGPPSLLYNGYRVFPGSTERSGRDADPSPPSSTVDHERVELYLYSPYGPYSLYRASVPVQGCTLPFTLFYHFMVNSRWKNTKNARYYTAGKSVTAPTLSTLRKRTYKGKVCYEGIWCNGGIPPLVLNLNNRWRWMVNFTDWPINPQHPPNRRMDGPQKQSGH